MSNTENKENGKQEKKYKTQYELSGADIKNYKQLNVDISKMTSKKTGSVIYSLSAKLNGIELKDKKFNGDAYLLTLVEHKKTLTDALKINKATIPCYYRPVKGTRKDNNQPFYGLDIFLSNSYRPRLFFTDLQLKLLELSNIHLVYEEVESDGSEFDSFE